jgi:cytosine/adenosine deaminase-related metal-dependent hydrolase
MTSRFLIRGGCVLTLGTKTPNFLRADVLVDDGRIVEAGPGLHARDAQTVDATDAIVMPGFVDTHRHTWRSLFRNLGDRAPDDPAAGIGVHYGPDELYAATLIGLLGAVEAGITTVVDWPEIGAGDGAAEAVLQAHADAGVRTVLVLAPRREDAEPLSGHLLARLAAAAGPMTTFAFGTGDLGSDNPDRVARDWAAARELGLRIHGHANPDSAVPGAIAALAALDLLGRDVTLAHCSDLDGADVEALAASGAAVSLAPSSDMAGTLGAPPIQHLIDRHVRPALGVDDERFAPGDMFAQMRALISLQHATVFDLKLAGKAGVPRLMSTRDVIRHATVDGAPAAGLGGVTGSLEPGMQADVIVLRTDRPNVFPINDPIGAVVWGMDTSNIDFVLAGGRVLVEAGVLRADVVRARRLATSARERVAVAAGLAIGGAV